MNHEEIIYADMQGAEEVCMLEQIRKILNLSSQSEFSVIRWNSPNRVPPENASYVMIKQYERGIGVVCSFASYEKQHFWDLLSRSDVPIHRESVIAWAYPPYDSRVTQTGPLKA